MPRLQKTKTLHYNGRTLPVPLATVDADGISDLGEIISSSCTVKVACETTADRRTWRKALERQNGFVQATIAATFGHAPPSKRAVIGEWEKQWDGCQPPRSIAYALAGPESIVRLFLADIVVITECLEYGRAHVMQGSGAGDMPVKGSSKHKPKKRRLPTPGEILGPNNHDQLSAPLVSINQIQPIVERYETGPDTYWYMTVGETETDGVAPGRAWTKDPSPNQSGPSIPAGLGETGRTSFIPPRRPKNRRK